MPEKERPAKGDFAEGERTEPTSGDRPDYAKGEREEPMSEDKPDYARGERKTDDD